MIKDDLTIPAIVVPKIPGQTEKEFMPIDPVILNDIVLKLGIDISKNTRLYGTLCAENNTWRYTNEENQYRETLATILHEIVNRITSLEENPHNVSVTY